MNPTQNKKSYEELVKRVEQLEKKLEQRPTVEGTYRNLRKDLTSYDDFVKTEKDIVFKKNAYIKNRRGVYDWAENVLALGFNETKPDKLNQIQIGLDRDDTTGESLRETNTVFIEAKSNPTANLSNESDLVKASNGMVAIGTRDENNDYGGFQTGLRQTMIGDKNGIASMIYGGETNGFAGIGNVVDVNGNKLVAVCFHTEQDANGGAYQQHIKHFVDLLPTTYLGYTPSLGRAGYAYDKLVLKSPDGSSWAVTINNSGTLIRTKL